jgi:RNA 3'-terminal phosphate cyclase (ATP)
MIQIDGAIGEGGGQILRSALTLSLLTQQPFRIRNVRARRPKPGLRPQHLEAVRAAATVSQAQVEGATSGSQSLMFTPGMVEGGSYVFEIKTAGSAPLVLQTILIPLCITKLDSIVTIKGGTHVPWSPCAEYLEMTWLPALAQMGYDAEVSCHRAGFFPRGGGLLEARIRGGAIPAPMDKLERSALGGFMVHSGFANLPVQIAQRQAKQAQKRLMRWDMPIDVRIIEYDALDRGTVLFILPQFKDGHASFFALGERGKPAEKVANEAVDQLESFLSCGAIVDLFLADQILIPLALAMPSSQFTTPIITKHLLTNAAVIEAFDLAEIKVIGKEGHQGRVEIQPRGFSS